MAFVRERIINGRPYRSMEWRWRERGKVRSRSQAIGDPSCFNDDRSLHGHSSEVEDMMQGTETQSARDAANAASSGSQSATEAPATEEAAGPSEAASSEGTEGESTA